MQEWIEVGPSPVTPTPADVARRVGTILGTLHRLAIPSDAPIGPHLAERRPDSAWHGLVDEARAAHKPWADQLAEAVPTLLDLRTIDAEIDDKERILCNRVLIPENVRMGRGDELVVTAWNLAGSLTAELELGSALTHWTLEPSLNPKAVAAFLDGYAHATGQRPKLELTSFSIAVTAWLNGTYDRICASINSSDDDNAEYSERETAVLLKQPMSRASLQRLLAAADT